MPYTAAPGVADNGTGTTLTNGTMSWLLTNVDGPNVSVKKLDTTHMGTTGTMTGMPADLQDPGQLTFSAWYDPSVTVTIGSPTTTWTLTYPTRSGQSTSANVAFPGFLSALNPGAPLEGLMTVNGTIEVCGSITRNPAT